MHRVALIAAGLLSASAVAASPATATSTVAEQIAALRAEAEALLARIAELEASQSAPAPVPAPPAAASAPAAPAVNAGWRWSGDFRYRNETIEQAFLEDRRHRDRIRARVGFTTEVQDSLRVGVRIATAEGFDARSSNVTLTNANQRKGLDLDLAYLRWMPADTGWQVTLGKMPLPWASTPSFFYDSDINPEGLAATWSAGSTGAFAGVYALQLLERSVGRDSRVQAVQAGWRGRPSEDQRWWLAASYFDHVGMQGYDPFPNRSAANAFGNTLVTDAAFCRRGVTTCLANDFDVLEVSGEYSLSVDGRPLVLFADFARNLAEESAGLDTAFAVGATYGRASGVGTWEIGYFYQDVEKDARYAQWLDSEFAMGRSDGGGSVWRAAYVPYPRWRLALTFMDDRTDKDVATTVTFPNVRLVTDRKHRRLHLDLGVSF